MTSAAPLLERQPAKPFLKWVGGKRQLLWAIRERVPEKFERYFEPFLGGGAVFFDLMSTRGSTGKPPVLADTNARLIRAYKGVRDDVEKVLRSLKNRGKTREDYYRTRDEDIDAKKSDAEVAAWLIYLNKTGYNGLYRVNSKNRFNVPFGRYEKPAFYDPETLRRCSDALADADIRLDDFEKAVAKAKRNDFVYFDPPYVPLSATSSFASYTKGGFDLDEQRRLRDLARSLKKRGVHVLLSNSSAPEVFELYKSGFTITPVQATRVVNSKASRRGTVTEVLIS
ncbi:MAG TPA: DNA adenine methylase [Polyangiaceae bacterium]